MRNSRLNTLERQKPFTYREKVRGKIDTDRLIFQVSKAFFEVVHGLLKIRYLIDEILPPVYEIQQHQVIAYDDWFFIPSWVDKSEIRTPCKLGFITRTDRLLN